MWLEFSTLATLKHYDVNQFNIIKIIKINFNIIGKYSIKQLENKLVHQVNKASKCHGIHVSEDEPSEKLVNIMHPLFVELDFF